MAATGEANGAGSVGPTALRTEYATDPLGVDEPAPRLMWLPTHGQTAYQVRVVSPDGMVLWDSDKVPSGVSQAVYGGTPLGSAQCGLWTVRTWDDHDSVSDWSEPASFEMGLLTPDDWRPAQWIGRHPTLDPMPAPLLRKEFHLPSAPIRKARLYVSALGYGVVHLDGQRVGDSVLDPAPTNYAATVLYTTHDVTGLLGESGDEEHAVEVELGRGRYGEPAPNVWFWHEAPWWDHPKLLLLLCVWHADGTVTRVGSDTSWHAFAGQVRYDSLYQGEHHDTTLPRHAGPWPHAVAVQPPAGVLRSQQMEPIRVVASHPPIAVTEPRPGVHLMDFGKQIAGHVRVSVAAAQPGTLRIRHGERLGPDGLVDNAQEHIQGDIQTDTYIFDRPGRFEPRFSYKGFQYVEITGPRPDSVEAVEAHTDVRPVGEFACSDETVNRIHEGTRRAVLNNLHGIPTDTPTYEKNGWTADAHLTANVAAYNFWMPRVYTKWLRDFADAQLPSGELPPIVPTSGWGYRGSDASITAPVPAWDAAYFEIPWMMYRHYGDERILTRHFDGQRRYVDFLVREALDGDGVVRGGLGDFLAPGSQGVPPEGPSVYETAYTYRILTLLSRVADVLGFNHGYREIAETVRSGFQAAFFDPATESYRGEKPTEYKQSPNVLALAFGLVPDALRERVLHGLVADIHARDNHLNTGVLGTRYLFAVLTEHGLVDLAFEVATQRTYPGYGHWLDLGATALYEAWEPEARSRNHHFYGSVDQWFFEYLAGLSPAEPGFARVRVKPVPPTALSWARARVDTIRGPVGVHWRRTPEGMEITADIPANVTGEIHVPGGEIVTCGEGRWTFHGAH